MEAHPSNIETAAQLENIHRLPSPSLSASVEAVRDFVHHKEVLMERAHHGGGWLLSGIICINILILGCAVVSGSACSEAVTAVHRQIFLIFLFLLTMLWMLLYTVFTSRKNQAVLAKDSHAGPVWLQGKSLTTLCLFVLNLIPPMFLRCSRTGAVLLSQPAHGHLQDQQLCGLPTL